MPRRKALPLHPFDRLHGTDTSGLLSADWLLQSLERDAGSSHPRPRPTDLTAYYGVAPSILRSLIRLWREELAPGAPLEETVFLDIGAGKGRALLLAAEFPFLRVEGVELSPQLAAIASDNILRRQATADGATLAPTAVHVADATRVRLPREPTLAFLFHPFERTVLRRFLRHVEASLRKAPRPFDLLYVNAEHGPVLDAHPAFQRLWAGRVPMSPEDHTADLEQIATQKEYGSTGDEVCAIYRAELSTE